MVGDDSSFPYFDGYPEEVLLITFMRATICTFPSDRAVAVVMILQAFPVVI